MQFSQSLKENHIFPRLYAKGNSSANRYLAVYCRKNRQKRQPGGDYRQAKLGGRGPATRSAAASGRSTVSTSKLSCRATILGRCSQEPVVTASYRQPNGPISIWPAGWVCCTAAMRPQKPPQTRVRKDARENKSAGAWLLCRSCRACEGPAEEDEAPMKRFFLPSIRWYQRHISPLFPPDAGSPPRVPSMLWRRLKSTGRGGRPACACKRLLRQSSLL